MERSDKKRILTKILIVIAALTLLSCCFLGSTFAKYVTGIDGTASMNIAKWDVAVESNAAITVDFNKLSPATNADNSGSHDTAWVKVATIVNTGDVAALVTIEDAVLSFDGCTWAEGADSAEGHGQYKTDTAVQGTYSITFAKDSSGTLFDSSQFTLADTNGTQAIYAQVTWTTQSNEQDTFFGQYLTSVAWTLSFNAVQNSQIPDQPQP